MQATVFRILTQGFPYTRLLTQINPPQFTIEITALFLLRSANNFSRSLYLSIGGDGRRGGES